MNVLTKIGRRVASLAAVGVVVAATMTALVPSASGATEYWRIYSATQRCLAAGVANNSLAYMAPCSTTDTYLQWAMVAGPDGGSARQFKNKATGRCLRTVETTSLNQDVTTTTCNNTADDQFWEFPWADEVVGHPIMPYLYNAYLRTTPASDTRVLTFDKAGYDNDIYADLRGLCYWTRQPA